MVAAWTNAPSAPSSPSEFSNIRRNDIFSWLAQPLMCTTAKHTHTTPSIGRVEWSVK